MRIQGLKQPVHLNQDKLLLIAIQCLGKSMGIMDFHRHFLFQISQNVIVQHAIMGMKTGKFKNQTIGDSVFLTFCNKYFHVAGSSRVMDVIAKVTS